MPSYIKTCKCPAPVPYEVQRPQGRELSVVPFTDNLWGHVRRGVHEAMMQRGHTLLEVAEITGIHVNSVQRLLHDPAANPTVRLVQEMFAYANLRVVKGEDAQS